jgi:hypothetical protein
VEKVLDGVRFADGVETKNIRKNQTEKDAA